MKVEQAHFTKKEAEIIHLICCEFSTPEIAEKLGNSERTIEFYRASILKKMNAKNTAGIIVYAIRNKLFKIN